MVEPVAGGYEHPFTIWSARLPSFSTPHEARDFLAQYQGQGFIRQCAHACVRPVEERYQVYCEENSFQVLMSDEPEPYETDSGIEYALQNEFHGCPEGCRLYQPRWRAPLNRLRAGFHPAHWFERQPWQVQVAVILAPLLALAIVFHVVKDLVALGRVVYEIVHGK
jgi:hypothetical protein